MTRCFGPDRVAGIEAGKTTIIARGWARLPEQRRTAVLAGRVGIDLDSTDVEVYGRRKRGVAYNCQGQRAGRPHLATWADTGLTLAGDLLTGVQDVRAHSSALLARAVAALPDEVRPGSATPTARWCAPTPGTSPPNSLTPRSGWALTSPSLRNATPRCGGPPPPSATTSGHRRTG